MSYNSVNDHRSMVFDEHRNQLYAHAIESLVNSNSAVLDLGAGLGLHGLLAARSGARMVYLVEPTSMIRAAEMVGNSNQLSDNTHYIHSTIEEADIPEPVDVIISVFTGNFLLAEDLLPSLLYARDRFLAPGGRLIPDRAKMEVVPVSAAEYYKKQISAWCTPAHDIDFTSVRKFAANNIYFGHPEKMKCEFLASPAEILDLDLMTAKHAECDSKVEVEISSDDTCHGWLGWFQARLGNAWLSTSPKEKKTHWNQAFLPLDPPLEVKAGQLMTFHLKRAEFGEWTWTVTIDGILQRHSTFLSSPLTPAELLRMSEKGFAKLNAKGKIALKVMQRLDGSQSTKDIASELVKDHPALFPAQRVAKSFIDDLIRRFT